MLLLKSIGAFFVKIWRWIKETAWIQPLLIVGAIFAVIFSIPNITTWVASWSGNSESAFYNKHLVSLDGEVLNNDEVSGADKLTKALYRNQLTLSNALAEGKSYNEVKDSLDLSYGTKFFFVYIEDNCSNCTAAEGGFKYLNDNWGKFDLKPSDSGSFAMKCISASEESDNDSDFETATNNSSAFNRYMINFAEFYNSLEDSLSSAPYISRSNIDFDDNTDYSNFVHASLESFPVPSILLVDYTEKAYNISTASKVRVGVSELIFSVTGSTNAEKAQYLMNMWNHTDDYSESNVFTAII